MRKLYLIIAVLVLVLSDTFGISSIHTGYTITKVRTASSAQGTYIIANTYEGTILAIEYDGTILWKNTLSGYMNHDLWCEDITGDGIDEILAANADGTVYCMDSEGELLWPFKKNEAPMNAVCVVRKDNTPYVVCGGYDKSFYYLSSTGSLVKEIKSSTYSEENSWGDNAPPNKLHITNFLRRIRMSDGTEVLAVLGCLHSLAAPGGIYLFDPLENLPYERITPGTSRPVGDLRICETGGTEQILLGGSGMIDNADIVQLNPASGAKQIAEIQTIQSQLDRFGYRVVQTEIIPDGSGYQYFVLFGSRILLLPSSMDINSAEILACRYSFNDMWYDRELDKIILASCQGGGSCVHVLDMNTTAWKNEYTNLTPPGKIKEILENTNNVNTQLQNFTHPSWEREPLPVYLCSESREGVTDIIDEIEANYNSPIFLNSPWTNKVHDPEDWNRDTLANEEYRNRRDTRKEYVWTQSEVLDFYEPAYNNYPGIAFWGGHGNDPYYFSLATHKAIINAAEKKKTVLIFPELEAHNSDFEFVLNDLIYPLAAYARGTNTNIFVRTKHTFWQSIAHLPLWSRMASGEFSEVFVPAMEETTDKSMELSLASRMGFWMSGATDSWGARCARDNTSFDRLRQHSHQMLPNHFLRQMIYNVSCGATYLDNFPVDQKYMSLFWMLIAKGALYVPKRSEIVSISPVHLSITDPDDYYLNEGNNVKWLTFYDEATEQANPLVFSHLNGTWPGAPVTQWDFSRYAADVKDRRLHYLPPYENGMVLITPRKDMIDNLHPMYKDIIKEYFTDGRNYYSADGSQSYPADQYYKTIEDDIKNRARLLPLTVSGGDVAWVVAQTAPTHYRLTLIDGGYLNPDDRIVTVNFHTIEPLHMVDLLDGKEFDISNPSSVTVDVPCGLFRFIDILTDGTVGIIDDYNENEEDLVIHEKLNKPDTETITTHHKSESLPEIEDESVSSTKQKTLRYAYIINNENTSPQSENISFVDSFNMSSQKIIEENGETGSIEAEPVLYASAENTTTENSPYDYKEQKTYTKPVKEESTILSEVNILDESLLGTIPTVKLYNKKDEVKKESIPVLPESKERKRAPIIGIIAATLLTSFGAMIMIKDQ